MRAALAAPCLLLCGLCPAQTLDQVRDALRDSVRSVRYPVFVTTLAQFAQDGQLSGGVLKIDGGDGPGTSVTSAALPFRRNFMESEGGTALRVEGTVGYVSGRVDIPDMWSGQLPGLETRVIADYLGFGFDVGAGPSLPLGDGWALETLAHVGVAYVESDADYIGPGAPVTQAVLEGILFDWTGTYGNYGVSAAVRREGWSLGEVEISPMLRVDARHFDDIEVDDPALRADDSTWWATFRTDFTGPLPISLADHPLRWHADLGYRRWFDAAADSLGIDDLIEIGLGLGWETEDLLPVSELQINGAFLFADDAIGWSIGVSARF